MQPFLPASWITPATLALITAVGPPDCATKRFPTNSAINSFQFRARPPCAPAPPMQDGSGTLPKRWRGCQSVKTAIWLLRRAARFLRWGGVSFPSGQSCVKFWAGMFIDEIRVYARAGHGGKGAVAFHREAYVPKGGPSGGNGGRGGDVILEADHDLNNLIGQFYNPRLIAESGEGGMGKGMDGHAGKDLIIKVPCGTLVWRLTSPKPPEEE